MLRVLEDAGVHLGQLHGAFFRHGHFADLEDYVRAVGSVWGDEVAIEILRQIRSDKDYEPGGTPLYPPETFFLAIPEPDFLTAVELGLRMATGPYKGAPLPSLLNRVCRARGIPYRLEGYLSQARFKWIGDSVVSKEVLEPALSALDDPRLAQGPKSEFETARQELRQGTPVALKQAVAEACNAVESGLKVLLTEHGESLPTRQNLDALIEAGRQAGLFPAAVDGKGVPVEQILAGPGRFGNRRGRHGGGSVPHDVTPEEAEAVVSAAAVALTLIAKHLP
jgi:hypothetical protein